MNWLKHIFAPKTKPAPDTRTQEERWSEILHWREDDEFKINCAGSYGFGRHQMYLISITATGDVYLSDYRVSHTKAYQGTDRAAHVYKYPLALVMRHAVNLSAQTRVLSDEMRQSDEYMALLRDFHESLKELSAEKVK